MGEGGREGEGEREGRGGEGERGWSEKGREKGALGAEGSERGNGERERERGRERERERGRERESSPMAQQHIRRHTGQCHCPATHAPLRASPDAAVGSAQAKTLYNYTESLYNII